MRYKFPVLIKLIQTRFRVWPFQGRLIVSIILLLVSLSAVAQQSPAVTKPGRRPPGKTVPTSTTATPVTSGTALNPIRPGGVVDSLIANAKDSIGMSDFKTTVKYSSKDSSRFENDTQTMELFGDAEVNYGQISLKADYIRLNYTTNEVYAKGRYDSTAKKLIGRPVFKDGESNYDTKEIRYNFKTKKGFIQGVVTTQGEGNIRGAKVKKDSSDNLYIRGAIYTTCNLATPHFHINAPKLKVIKNKQVVSGPFNLVINQVPLPIGLPFGFFPFPKKKDIGVSGIIVPQYGEEPNGRGYYLRDGGYYFAISENIGVQLKGQIYTNGSWGLGTSSVYNKRYRYSGSFNLNFARNRGGDRVDTTTSPRNDFSIQWNHAPVPRGRATFSASVNITSNSYNQYQSFNTQRYISNVAGSSVQYNRQLGAYARTGISFRVNQQFGQLNPLTNVRTTGKTDAGIDYNFGLNQISPFALKGGSGKWYESFRFGFDFSGTATISNTIVSRVDTSGLGFVINQNGATNLSGKSAYDGSSALRPTANTTTIKLVNTTQNIRDSLLRADSIRTGLIVAGSAASVSNNLIPFNVANLPFILGKAVYSNRYSIPISLPNVKLFRYINLTPGISLSGDIYTKKLRYTTFTDVGGRSSVRVDTMPGFFPTYNVSFNASMNTRAYGTIFIRSRRIEAIRHTIAPSISFSYVPDLSNPLFGQFTTLDIPGLPDTKRKVSNFRGLGGSAGSGLPRASSLIAWSLVNQLEMKVRSRGDSAGNDFKKIPIFDNLSLSGSYDLLAPQFAFSTINVSANTQIFKNISLNFTSTFDPYALQPYGGTFTQTYPSIPANVENGIGQNGQSLLTNVQYIRINRFAFQQGQGLLRMTNASLFISTRFSPKGADKPKKATGVSDQTLKAINQNPDLYVDFNIPWSVNVSYSFSLSKYNPELSSVVQALTLTGDFSLTPKWKFTFNTGYDIANRSPTLTNIGINRDLHCWEMAFNWTPYAGSRQRTSNYSFDLRVRSAILQELKLSRRRSFYDRGGF